MMRENDCLPQGNQALLFPDVYFNVPGLFQFAELVYKYVDLANIRFGVNMPIKYLYGAPPVRWNGGRTILNQNSFSLSQIEDEIFHAASKGITPLVTFSNHRISELDLEDRLCNDILDLLNHTKGGVIISSQTLLNYVRKHYPNMCIHASVIMCALENNRDASFYQHLSSKFEHYVVHPDDLFNLELIKSIPQMNGELLINERCFRNCKIRKGHYNSIAREQESKAKGIDLDEKFLTHCKAIPEHKQLNPSCRNISLSINEVKQLLGLGFKTIKIQGRTDNLFVFFFDLMRYTLESEIAFPSMFPAFSYIIQDYINGVH